jgi:hypothetical protein
MRSRFGDGTGNDTGATLRRSRVSSADNPERRNRDSAEAPQQIGSHA